MNSPIRIAGTGPAGLAAAITLAQAGREVEVYERHPNVGMRFHGDMQGLENWTTERDVLEEFAQYGIQANFDYTAFHTLTIIDPTGQRFVYHTPLPLLYMIRRGKEKGSFDQGLKIQAEEAGARIAFNVALDDEDADIVATGPSMHHIYAVDTGITFTTDHPNCAYGLLDDEAAYQGYAYLLVADGHGCLCNVLFNNFSEARTQFQRAKEALLAATHMKESDCRNVQEAGGVGSFSANPVFEKNGRMYVGEAAGIQDCLWGFGDRTAILSGVLAARAILQGTSYTRAASQAFRNYLRNGIVNRYLFTRGNNTRYHAFLSRVGTKANPRTILHNLYTFSTAKKLLYPWAQWRLRKSHPQLHS